MANLKIKDAPLAEQLTGKEKIPISNGSNQALTITIDQIKNLIDSQILEELIKLNSRIDKITEKLNIKVNSDEEYDLEKIIARLENLEATDFTTEDY